MGLVYCDRSIQEFKDSDRLPILTEIEPELSVHHVFSWLSF
jgi:hypothetical protein